MDMKRDTPVIEDRPDTELNLRPGDSSGGGNDIRCPLCGWTPSAEDRWICRCNHLWNTFDTGGVCPNCLYQWAYTCCLACHGWSLHSDWYKNQ